MALEELVPPNVLEYGGYETYKAVGKEFLNHFIKLGNLQPGEKVLDVGCGIGRMAVPLTGYLSSRGSYDGFDIVKPGIDWCQDKITPTFPNFRFHWVNLFNKWYNPKGRIQPSRFKLPFTDQAFDFIFLTSVFTHMFTRDMENYVQEISRTLKIGGGCLITFFLMNRESACLIQEGKSTINFQFARGTCYSNQSEIPEAVVSHDESSVSKLFEENGLELQQPIHYGIWCGRKHYLSYQDLVVARKRRHVCPKSAPLRLFHFPLFSQKFRKVRSWNNLYRILA